MWCIFFSDYEKICVRCGKRFMVFPNGTYAHEEECCYHWGKAWKKKSLYLVKQKMTEDMTYSHIYKGKLNLMLLYFSCWIHWNEVYLLSRRFGSRRMPNCQGRFSNCVTKHTFPSYWTMYVRKILFCFWLCMYFGHYLTWEFCYKQKVGNE
jgi:hypothetical protein